MPRKVLPNHAPSLPTHATERQGSTGMNRGSAASPMQPSTSGSSRMICPPTPSNDAQRTEHRTIALESSNCKTWSWSPDRRGAGNHGALCGAVGYAAGTTGCARQVIEVKIATIENPVACELRGTTRVPVIESGSPSRAGLRRRRLTGPGAVRDDVCAETADVGTGYSSSDHRT